MSRMKYLALVGAVALLASHVQANEVTSVTARQRWPWNGLVDIDYVVEGTNTGGILMSSVTSGGITKPLLALTGDISAEAGEHRITWDSAADWLELDAEDVSFGLECHQVELEYGERYFGPTAESGKLLLVSANVAWTASSDVNWLTITQGSSGNGDGAVQYNVSISPGVTNRTGHLIVSGGGVSAVCTITQEGWPLYCVVNLSSGASSTNYPVTYLDEPPSGGFNTDAYKTTNLVLKLCPSGTFIMGDDQTDENHRVTLTKPFYMGLFEVTQRQWELVTGSNPSTSYGIGNTYPVYYVSYRMIRGDASSFLGKLRARTGVDFDLPTEAQWEYACRAGTTTTYSYGNSADGAYMWYTLNSGSKTHPVGQKKANPWGLYDMHGNVWEWCLDWYGNLAYGTDPKGSSSGSNRVERGGGWGNSAVYCTSSRRDDNGPSYASSDYGFRLARALP